MKDCLLEAREISLVRGKKSILGEISISLYHGEVLALIGHNGAGKSSLVQVLAGLFSPDKGQLIFRGTKIDDFLSFRRQVAVVFQEPLLVNASVQYNAALGLYFRGMNGSEAAKFVDPWLERLGILHLAQQKADHLSGGEAQRLAIARSLVLKPQILFLDEPFAKLDALTRNQLRAELASILKEDNITAILVTHDFQELPSLADRVAALENGRLIQVGKVRDILDHPVKHSLARLVGMDNLWRTGSFKRRESGWEIALPGGQTLFADTGSQSPPEWVGIRPEKIRLDDSSANVLTGVVKSIIPYGSLKNLSLDCGFELRVQTASDWIEKNSIKPGDQIKVSVDPRDIHLLGG